MKNILHVQDLPGQNEHGDWLAYDFTRELLPY